jgi:hypothetical protein
MAVFDLENQFFQVKLAPETKQYFGFSVPDTNGRPRYYQFTVMAYGCKPAVSVVTRLLKPVKAFLHRNGVKFSVYVDDGRVAAATSADCRRHFCLTLHVLLLAGWKIQWKKTVTAPSNRLLYLGFIADTDTMLYTITPEKWANISTTISSLTAAAESGTPVSVRLLAALLGKLVSIRRSHGPITAVLSRHLQHLLGLHVRSIGWSGEIQLDSFAAAELVSLHRLLPSFNGHLLPTAPLVFHRAARPLTAVTAADTSSISYRLLPDDTIAEFSSVSSPAYVADLHQLSSYITAHFPPPSLPTLVFWPTSLPHFPSLVNHGSLSFCLRTTGRSSHFLPFSQHCPAAHLV